MIEADERVAGYARRGRVVGAVALALAMPADAWTISATRRVAHRIGAGVRALEPWQRVRVYGGVLLVALTTHAVVAVAAGQRSPIVFAAWTLTAAAGTVLVACPRPLAIAWRRRSVFAARGTGQ